MLGLLARNASIWGTRRAARVLGSEKGLPVSWTISGVMEDACIAFAMRYLAGLVSISWKACNLLSLPNIELSTSVKPVFLCSKPFHLTGNLVEKFLLDTCLASQSDNLIYSLAFIASDSILVVSEDRLP